MFSSLNRSYTFENVIDCHVHPIRSFATTESLILEMNRANVQKAVLLALDLDPNILDSNYTLREEIIDDLWAYSMFINHEQILEVMKKILEVGNTPNNLVANIVKNYPNKFIGFGSVNPSKSKNYVKNKLVEILDLDLRGIKLIPTLQFFHPKKNKNLKYIFKFALRHDWPILIHSGRDPGPWEIHTLRCVQNTHPKHWMKIIRKNSSNKIIFAHLGGYGETDDESWLDTVLEMHSKNDNVFLDTSAVTYHLELPSVVHKIRQTCGFDKILFGTDTPVVQGTSMSHSKAIIENNPLLTHEEKRKILFENSKTLLQI